MQGKNIMANLPIPESKMSKEKTPITVNDKEYILEDFTDRQRALLNHINDLDRKIGNSQFNLEQLSFCRTKFIEDLAQDLESEEITDEDYEEVSTDSAD
jgi:hypothetical protein